MGRSIVGTRLTLPPAQRASDEVVGDFAKEMLTSENFHNIKLADDAWDREKRAGSKFNASVKQVFLANNENVVAFADQTAYVMRGMTLGYAAMNAVDKEVAKAVKAGLLRFELEEESKDDAVYFVGLCSKAKVRRRRGG